MAKMKNIIWDYDKDLFSILKKYDFNINVNEYSQYAGGEYFYIKSWEKHIIGSFPKYAISSDKTKLLHSPENIIKCFQDGQFLSSLVLTILWGNMIRTKNRIYTKSLKEIDIILENVYKIILNEGNVEKVWNDLRNSLGWSNVIISKFLHFAFRSAEYINPPVPIDNLIIRYRFWPDLKEFIETNHSDYTLISWFDKNYSWKSYENYMTVVLALAEKNKTTTTKIENAIFGLYL